MATSTDPSVPPFDLKRDCRVPGSGSVPDRVNVFRTCPWLAVPLAVGNLAAVYWGWTIYYSAQFGRTEVWLWPFVSDSPNAVLSLAVALLLFHVRVRAAWLDLLAWILNVKVGLWTIYVFIYFPEFFFSAELAAQSWFLLVLHAGMVAQAFIVHKGLRTHPPGWIAALIVTTFVAIDLVLDYGPNANHPGLPGGPFSFATDFGVVSTLIASASVAAAWSLYRPDRRRGATGSLIRAGRPEG